MKTRFITMWVCATALLIATGTVNAQSDSNFQTNMGYLTNLYRSESDSDAQSKSDLQEMYLDYLKDQGYQPEIDSDGDILFKAEGSSYYIIVDEDDLESFRILYPGFWEIESLSEKAKVYEVVNYINRTKKIVKAYLHSTEDNVSMDANILIETPEDFKLHFRRMLNLLISQKREFREKMNE